LKKTLFIGFLFFFFSFLGKAQLVTYQFEDLEKLEKENPKPIIIFVHTSWCKYCAMMEETTLQDSTVQNLLNEKVYFVSFDAEQKTPIQFLEKKFKYQPHGNDIGVHELAKELATTNGVLNYPTFVFLNQQFEIDFIHPGVIKKEEFVTILNTY